MRPRSSVAALAALAVACSGGGGPTGSPLPPPPPAYDFSPLTALLQGAVDSMSQVQGAAVLLLQDGHVVYERGFGTLTVDSQIPIASASKWLTAFTVLTLVDTGRVSLDAPIDRYIDSFDRGFWRDRSLGAITLRQLLSQTSGFRISHPCIYTAHKTLEECAMDIGSFGLMAPPGQGFVYGQGTFQVAGAVVEGATGRPWGETFGNRVTRPLGLTRTSFQGGQNPQLGDGAVSSVRDFATFLRAIQAGGVHGGRRVLAARWVEEMLADQTAGVPVVFSPREPDLQYGLGVWRDRPGPGSAPLEASGPGSLGFWPWIDFERRLVGVIAVPPHLTITGGVVDQARRIVREIVPPAN